MPGRAPHRAVNARRLALRAALPGCKVSELGACLQVSAPVEALAAQVAALLEDRAGLASVGERATAAASGWGEAAAGEALEAVVVRALGGGGGATDVRPASGGPADRLLVAGGGA